MKKFVIVFLGLVAIVLVAGCGTKETEEKLVCTGTQQEEGMSVEQVISMTFKNDKL